MPLLVVVLLVSACAVIQTPKVVKVALVAPFEGRYREVGYEALYAARLALKDAGADSANPQVDLLAVDDGGTEAANRARALTDDPQVAVVLALGYAATAPETLRGFGDLPVLVVGDWGAQPVNINHDFILSNPAIDTQLTVSPRISITDAAALPAPLIGGDVFALEGFAKLRTSFDGVTIISSGSPLNTDFIQRYKASDPFAPDPGLVAGQTYDATKLALWMAQNRERDAAQRIVTPVVFVRGYLSTAEIYRYHYENGVLTADDAVK